MMQTSASPSQDTARPSGTPANSEWVIALAALALMGATVAALRQEPRPDPLTPASPLDFWWYPLERKAHLRLPLIDSDLHDVCASADGRMVWAVGTGGLILNSRDAGLSWTRVDVPPGLPTQSLPAKSAVSLSLIGNAHAGEPPPAQTRPNPARQEVRAPADYGGLDYLALHCGPNGQVWVAGENGVLLFRTGADDAWQVQQEPEPVGGWRGLLFTDEYTGWAPGDHGRIAFTTDAGARWQELDVGEDASLKSAAQRGNEIVVVGEQGLLVRVFAGKPSVERIETAQGATLHSVHFFDERVGMAVGEQGLALLTRDGGQTWAPAQIPGVSGETLLFVHAALPDRVLWGGEGLAVLAPRFWIAGDAGKALRYTPALSNLAPSTSAQSPADVSVSFRRMFPLDDRRVWLVGDGGALLYSDDGGTSWQARSRGAWLPVPLSLSGSYSRWPAPWYWLLLLALLPLTIAVRRQVEDRAVRKRASASVADLLASDRPLRPGDPDPVGLREIAAGLSRFIRNQRTVPPLTIAVTGAWGTGKSSLMNLLRDDLRTRGFRPVWFNAWHHQKGEQLVASLFANIRGQALPSWFSFGGVEFRLRLLWRRGWHNKLWATALLGLVVLAAVYFAPQPQRIAAVSAWLTTLFQALFAEKDDASTAAALSLFGSLIVPPLIALWRGLRAFGLNPVALMHTVAGNLRGGEVKEQPAARYRFAHEFEDVTAALTPYRLVIFIDDIDRCAPDHVVEVLEAVNFLVSSGECFIVLGMDPKWVQTCVGLTYEEIAKEAAEDLGQPLDARQLRQRFAQHYLEKLINIAVPVPKLDAVSSKRLLAPELPAAPGRWERLRDRLQASSSWAAVAATVAVAAALALRLPELQAPVEVSGVSTALVAQSATSAAEVEPEFATLTSSGGGSSTWSSRPAKFETGRAANNAWVYGVSAVLVLGLLAALIWASERRRSLLTDSAEFRLALQIWHPWLQLKLQTPRAIKRYLNLVRYTAMRLRGDREPPGLLRNVWQWLRKGAAESQDRDAARLNEPNLVALSAMRLVAPGLLQARDADWNSALMLAIQNMSDEWARTGMEPQAIRDSTHAMEKALEEYRVAFGRHWPPAPAEVEAFLDVLAEGRLPGTGAETQTPTSGPS